MLTEADIGETVRFAYDRSGFEQAPTGYNVIRRHAHFYPYACIVLDGGYDQASFIGRVRLEPGDAIVQPVLDRHEIRQRTHGHLRYLLLPWSMEAAGLGGHFRPAQIDLVIRAARRDLIEASGLLSETLRSESSLPVREADWPDQLAAVLRKTPDMHLGDWAHGRGLTRETITRGFYRAFGVSPGTFGQEIRAREAWIRTVFTNQTLATIAADLAYADQAHMTRAVRRFTGATPALWRRRQILRSSGSY